MSTVISIERVSQIRSSSPEIQFNNVAVRINQSELLSNVCLTVEAGSWLGIVGPNGGGKSTLLKAMLGLQPYEGEISYSWPGTKKGRIGYVPQLAPIEPTLPITVLDYLRMVYEDAPVWWRCKHRSAIKRWMATFEITQFATKKLGALSTGERQRVFICGAMLCSPDVLLLDEPLAGVDKTGQKTLLAILQNYHQQGNTIIMVEHHWQVIEQYCQYAALIDGDLIDIDTPVNVLQTLQQRDEAAVLTARR